MHNHKHLEENGLSWDVLPAKWPDFIPEDYKKNRRWIFQEDGQILDSNSKYGQWLPPDFLLLKDETKEYNFPICFGFPAGHIDNNTPIILGKKSFLKVSFKSVILQQNYL